MDELERRQRVLRHWASKAEIGSPDELKLSELGGTWGLEMRKTYIDIGDAPRSAYQSHFRLAFPLLCRPSLASVGGWGRVLKAMPPLSAYQSHFRLAFPLLCRLSPLCRLTNVTLGWLSLPSVGLPCPLSVEGGVGFHR